jgi:quinol monooxygenase YgiN
MVIVAAIVKFDAKRAAEMLVAARQAEGVCRELPGCLRYVLAQPVSGEGELLASEAWTDMKSFEEHTRIANAEPSLADWRGLVLAVSGTVYVQSDDGSTGKGDAGSSNLWRAITVGTDVVAESH